MSTMVERDRRWAVIGDDAGHLSTGPSAPSGAGFLAVLGLLSIAVAVWAVGAGAPPAVPARQAPVSLESNVDVSTFETHEPVARQASTSSYALGQSSRRHHHSGLHPVTAESATLSVYGRACTAAAYGPWQSYLGGDEPDLARNESEGVLDTAAAYLVQPSESLEGFPIHEAPPLCSAS